MSRPCQSSRCRHKLLVLLSGDSKKRPSKMTILNKLSPVLFSQWSEWSQCSPSCYTKRTRKCLVKGICDNTSMREDYKQCYRHGDDCEKMFFDKQQNLQSDDPEAIIEDELEDDFPLYDNPCGIANVSVDLKITGGRPSVKGNWPWQALLLNAENEPFCGGILLSKDWVLTAAHCIRKILYARVGEYDLSRLENTEQQEIAGSIFVHLGYDKNHVDNDIALFKMQSPFQLNSFVQPICLPKSDEKLPIFARATILGWGKRRNSSNYGTDILHQAEVPVVPTAECQDSYYDQYIDDRMLCAGYETGKVDSCKGDSGGPLMHKREDGSWVVFGVTSFGDGCGDIRKYGVYANVLKYLPWIKSIIRSDEISFDD